MKLSVILALLFVSRLAAQSQVIYDDFRYGNRTNCTASQQPPTCLANFGNPYLWQAYAGGLHETYPFSSLSVQPGQYLKLTVDSSSEPAYTITGVTPAPAGFPCQNCFYLTVSPYEQYNSGDPVVVSGVTGSGGITAANGTWLTMENYTSSIAASGSPMQIRTSDPHGMTTGEHVWINNCVTNSAVNLGVFTVTAVNSTTLILNGSAGPACNNGTEVHDAQHIALYNTSYAGTYASAGTVKRVGNGFDLLVSTNPWNPYPDTYAAGNIVSGTWNPNFNRFQWEMQCTNSYVHSSSPSDQMFNLGTYVKDPSTPGQADHWYHWFWPNTYANRVTHFIATRTPQHTNQLGSNWAEFMEDASYYQPLSYQPMHYWDGLQDFYIEAYAGGDPAWQSFSCQFSNFRFLLTPGEADTYVANLAANWHPTTGSNGVYEVSWMAPAYVPGGVSYEVRYSTTGSCHGRWSACTSGGSASGADNSAYVATMWKSPQMPEAANIWIGVRPTYSIMSATGDSGKPIVVTTFTGHDIPSGDTVSVSGLPNVPAGNYTATSIPPQRWTTGDGSLVSISVTNGIATATTSTPHGLTPGREVFVLESGVTGLDTPHAIITSATSTTFSWATDAAGSGLSPLSAGMPKPYITSLRAVSLAGTSGTGPVYSCTAAPCGTILPTTPERFSEVQIPRQGTGITPPPLSACDLNGDGVVDLADVQLSINAALGTQPCTTAYRLDNGPTCNVEDVQRVINAALGGACRTGQ